VTVSRDFYDASPAHTLVEVWIPELGKWVLMDSMFNAMFLVDGKPASLVEIYRAVSVGQSDRLVLERNGAVTEPAPTLDKPYLSLFRHLFYRNATVLFDALPRYQYFFGSRGIGIVHFSGEGIPDYPERQKVFLLRLSALFFLGSCVFFAAGVMSVAKTFCTKRIRSLVFVAGRHVHDLGFIVAVGQVVRRGQKYRMAWRGRRA
jgi:hypothetical protein